MRRAIPLFVAAALLTSCSDPMPRVSSNGAPDPRLVIETGERTVRVDVEVADEDHERRAGLMGRQALTANAGMVFLFDEPVRTSFWMKDTLIPLSIAFWNDRGMIVAILDMDPCESDPCPSYDPGIEFEGALEVNQGFFEEHGISVGDHIELLEPDA